MVNTSKTTHEKVAMLPEDLSIAEIVLLVTFTLLALYAVIKLFIQFLYTDKD